MDIKEFKSVIEQEHYIKDIYKYCDSYCEYCEYSSKCLNYSLLEKYGVLQKLDDSSNILFWQQLKDEYEVSLDYILKYADTIGFDLDARLEDNKSIVVEKHKLFLEIVRIQNQTLEILERTEEFVEKKKQKPKVIFKLSLKKKKVPIEEECEYICQVNEPIFWLTYQLKYNIIKTIEYRLEGNKELSIRYVQISHRILHKLVLLWSVYIQKLKVAEIEFMPLIINVYWTYLNVEDLFPELNENKNQYFLI